MEADGNRGTPGRAVAVGGTERLLSAGIGRLRSCLVKSGRQIQEPGQFTRRCRISLAFFLEASYVRCLRFGTAGGIRGRSGRPGAFVSPLERGGLALVSARGNRKAGFRNRAYSPGTRDVFPVQRLLPVGREVRRAS